MAAENQTETNSEALCYIVENIDDFSFQTPQAQEFKRDLRRWYYGERESDQAEKLLRQFRSLFSGKVILDQVGMLLWSVAEPSPAISIFTLKQALSQIPRGDVTGRTIRVYDAWRNEAQLFCQLNEQREGAVRTATSALEGMENLYKEEQVWYQKNGVTVFSLLTALVSIFALLLGLLWMFQTASILLQGGLSAAANCQPIQAYLGQEITLVLMGLCLLDTLLFLVITPYLLMTLYAGALWFFYLRWHIRQRAKRMVQIRAMLTSEGLKTYCQQLQRAVHTLAQTPSGAPKNADPTRELLGGSGLGMRKWKGLPPRWDTVLFCQRLERWHLRFPETVLGGSCVLVVLLTILHCGIPF